MCGLVALLATPSHAASQTDLYKATINVSELNIRSGPGLQYPVTRTLTTGDTLYLSGTTQTADGYTWFQVYPSTSEWIAYTGGWSYKPISMYSESIKGYDLYGDIAWSHYCSYTSEDNMTYTFDVYANGYTVSCSCGWTHNRITPEIENTDGVLIGQFYGLDTDNDEIADIFPTETRTVSHTAVNGKRDLQVLEIYKNPSTAPQKVTITFASPENELIAQYIFDYRVYIKVLPEGIEMTDYYGNVILYEIDTQYFVRDRLQNFVLGDIGRWYTHKDLAYGDMTAPVEYVFTLTVYDSPLDDDLSTPEKIVALWKQVSDWLDSLLSDFGGLGIIFTDPASPFAFIAAGGLDGAQEVFECISAFFTAIPPPLLAVCLFGFVGSIVIFFVRWFM